jgi:hypothetical protein
MNVGAIGGIIGGVLRLAGGARSVRTQASRTRRAQGTTVHGASSSCRVGWDHALPGTSLRAAESIPVAHLDPLWRGPTFGNRFSQSKAAADPVGRGAISTVLSENSIC